MSAEKIFVIILNYNGKDTIRTCLESVFYSDYPNFEVVVVDNNSTDGSLEIAKNIFPKFHFIKNEKNIGFGSGNNIGIRFALERMADYVFLLNNDAALEKDTLSKMINNAKEKNFPVSSPVIRDKNNEIWFSGGEIKWLTMKTVHKNKLPESENPYPTDYVSGCAMLVRKDVFQKTGLFDEDYFLYYEDADFCFRAGKKGLKSFVVPEARVKHWEKSQSDFSGKTYWLVVSGLIFFGKNTPSLLYLWVKIYQFLRRIKNMHDRKNKKNELAKVVEKAYQDYKIWKKSNKYPLSS
jgi:GT2 family glycosyltransferase